jgi:ribosomal protein L22
MLVKLLLLNISRIYESYSQKRPHLSQRNSVLSPTSYEESQSMMVLLCSDLFSKKGGDILYKVLFSAASNAIHNDGATKDDLVIHALSIAQGPTYKRARPVGRGRSHRILKHTSHVFLELAHK